MCPVLAWTMHPSCGLSRHKMHRPGSEADESEVDCDICSMDWLEPSPLDTDAASVCGPSLKSELQLPWLPRVNSFNFSTRDLCFLGFSTFLGLFFRKCFGGRRFSGNQFALSSQHRSQYLTVGLLKPLQCLHCHLSYTITNNSLVWRIAIEQTKENAQNHNKISAVGGLENFVKI